MTPRDQWDIETDAQGDGFESDEHRRAWQRNRREETDDGDEAYVEELEERP